MTYWEKEISLRPPKRPQRLETKAYNVAPSYSGITSTRRFLAQAVSLDSATAGRSSP